MVINDFEQRLNGFAERAKKREEEKAEFLVGMEIKKCKRHDIPYPIDWFRTEEETKKDGVKTLVYGFCEKCEDEHKEMQRQHTGLNIPKLYLPKKLDDLNYATPQGQKNLLICQQYAARPKGFLILHGETKGNGKTHAAIGILKKQSSGWFITQSELLAQHRARYDDKRVKDIRSKCMYTPLLVIDEVGVSVGGKDEGPLIYDILNHRYSQLMPTVLTSNCATDQIKEFLGERVVDRISEAVFAILHFSEAGKRSKQNANYLGINVNVHTDTSLFEGYSPNI